MNSLSKISSATHPQTAAQKKEDSVNSPRVTAKDSKTQKETVPPTLTTAALAVPGNADNANLGHSEAQLKRQGLESLVAVLRSLLTWGTAAGKSANDSISESASFNQSTGSAKVDGMTSDYSLDKLSAPYGSNLARVSTPELSDDPGRFESEKQRKNTLQEGVRRFNYKPKKVCFVFEMCMHEQFIDIRIRGLSS
jgi:brefeldin A-inhibited guanine nucleotide-exchange protein